MNTLDPETLLCDFELAIAYTNAPSVPQVDQLIHYFNETWLNGRFTIKQWIILIMQVLEQTTTLKGGILD